MSYIETALNEVKRVTPKKGVNVCIYDDYEDVGNKLETIANFDTVEEAQSFIDNYEDDVELVMYEAEILEESNTKYPSYTPQKNHGIDTYIEKSFQDLKSGKKSDNDEYEEIDEWLPNKTIYDKSNEEFVEQEHPRDEDGKFTSKWEISTFVGGHEIPVTQREKDNWEKHTTEEQRKDSNFTTMYGDKLKEKARGKGWDESEDVEKEDVEKEIVEPQPPEERPQGKNYRIESMTNKLKNHIEYMEGVLRKVEKHNRGEVQYRILKMQDQLSNLESEKDVKKRVKLPNLPMGKNTHTKHTEGFVHSGKTKVKVERSFFDNDPMNKFRWELDLVQSAWNNLPDEVRDMVGNLNIKKSRASGRYSYRNGSWDDRNKTLTMNITTGSTNAETLYHEIGHARWYHMKETNSEKIDEFIAEVNKVGVAITKYAEGYRGAERREMVYRRRWLSRTERIKELDPKRYEKNMKTLDARLKNVKDLYQNENHSELNSYIMGEMREDDKTNPIMVSDDRLKRLIIAYKNLWGIEN